MNVLRFICDLLLYLWLSRLIWYHKALRKSFQLFDTNWKKIKHWGVVFCLFVLFLGVLFVCFGFFFGCFCFCFCLKVFTAANYCRSKVDVVDRFAVGVRMLLLSFSSPPSLISGATELREVGCWRGGVAGWFRRRLHGRIPTNAGEGWKR